MNQPKFIGTVAFGAVEKTFDPLKPWNPLALDEIPYSVISYAPGYLFTLGSGCYSAPTISVYDLKYISGIDVFRQDPRGFQIRIDIDHYIAVPFKESFGIYIEPPNEDHHFNLFDERLNYIKPVWQSYVRDVLGGKIKF